MSLHDFYMERINLSNDRRFRASMRGSPCYQMARDKNGNIIRDARGNVCIYFEEMESCNFSKDQLEEIARYHGKELIVNEYGDSDLSEWSFSVPMRSQVCPTCEGTGSVVNPAIDAGGLTSEQVAQWDYDPDYDDDCDSDDESHHNSYMRGKYNISCPECKGENVVRAPAFDKLARPLVEYVKRYERELDEDLDVQMAEFRAGC